MDGKFFAVGVAGILGGLATLKYLRNKSEQIHDEPPAPVITPSRDAKSSRAIRLLEITRDIGLQGDLTAAISKLLHHTSQLVGADRCTLFLADRTVAPGFLYAGV
jgi:hypothetical protein